MRLFSSMNNPPPPSTGPRPDPRAGPRTGRPAALLAAGLAAALAGCAGQPYAPPATDVPAAFKEAFPARAGVDLAADAAALWQPADPGAADAVPADWWTVFGDPVLDDLQRRVAAGNFNLQAGLAQLRAAQAALGSSQAALLPAVGANLGRTRSDSGGTTAGTVDAAGNPVGTTGGRPRTVNTLSASASWEVDLWGRLSGAVDAARARVDASAADLAALRLSTQATLAQTYLAMRAAEAQAALLDDTLAAYRRSLRLTRNRYEAGVASAADVAQAEAQLESAEAQRIESGIGRAQLEHAVAVLAGLPPAALDLPRTARLPEVPALPPLLPARLLERRPDVAAAERRVAAANAQIGVARAAFFPALTLSASAGYRNARLGELLNAPNLFWSIGPALALSVFDGGARRAAVASAAAATDQAAAAYRQTVLSALQEVEDNLAAAAGLAREEAVQARARTAARRAQEIAENQYAAGIVSYLNVVTAQATALQADRTLIDLRNRRLAAANLLLRNLAGGWEPAGR
jgi:NodT family efflux transporter outer membrane factor (OMF) lipoprotein